MRQINEKEFAARVDDRISEAVHGTLVNLMAAFEREGFLRNLDGMEEAAIESDTWAEAENLKFAVYGACVRLGLDVEGDGRDF